MFEFAIYAVHMQSYMLPSHSMGSWCCLESLQLPNHLLVSFLAS